VKCFEHHPGVPWVWEAFKDGFEEDALSGPEGVSDWFREFIDNLEAASCLERDADGDYSPDPAAARFPAWENQVKGAVAFRLRPGVVSIHEVFERWKRESVPAASTVATWKGFVKSFVSHLGEDMGRVTCEGLIAWKDASVSQGYSTRSLRDSLHEGRHPR
jgi:hypothetical protein